MKTKRPIFLCALGSVLVVPMARARGHGDIIRIAATDSTQGWPQVRHGPNADPYPVVW